MFTQHIKPWRSVCLLLIGALAVPAWAGEGEAGDCGPGNVEVRGKKKFKNRTGKTADDFHFYMYQNDRPNVVVNGAKASSSSFDNVSVELGTDNGTDNPPPGDHGAKVEMSGGSVAAGDSIEVEVSLCMNERNVLKMKDIEWTFTGGQGGDGGPPQKARRNNGWRMERPFPGGRGGNPGNQEGNGGVGRWKHRVCIENDSDDPLPLRWVKLFASMTRYDDLEDINWDAVPEVHDAQGQPPVSIPPWGRWCIDFETTGSYFLGHIYIMYAIEPVDQIGVAGGFSTQDDEEDLSIGDHPEEDLMLSTCLTGRDLWQTISPTEFTFGSDFPPIPEDFFNPGSLPFEGTVYFCGSPIDPALYGNTDTIIQRLAEAEAPEPGNADTVPIELHALNLVSCQPIVVQSSLPGGDLLQDALQGFTSSSTPSNPILVGVSTAPPVSGETEVELVRLAIPSVSPPGIEVLMTGQDDGGPPGLWGVDSFFDITYLFPPGNFPPNSLFSVFVNISDPFGGTSLPMPLPPQAAPDGTGGFDVHWNVELGDGLVASHHLNLRPSQPPVFMSNVQANQMQPGQSVFGLQVMLGSFLPGAVLPEAPVVQATLHIEQRFAVDSFFDVFLTLDADQPSEGSMEILRDSPNGGTFTTELTYTPLVTFQPVGLALGEGAQGAAPSQTLPGVGPITVTGGSSWRHDPPPPDPFEGSGANFWPLPELPMPLTTGAGSPHTLVQTLPEGPPTLVFADSRRTHGPAGDFDLDLLNPLGAAAVAVEDRTNAPTLALLTFNKPIHAPGGLPGAAALAGGGTLSVLTLADYELTVAMSDVPDGARSTLSFAGLADGEGNVVAETLCFGRMTGDVNGDTVVNVLDLVQVRNRLNQAVGLASLRADVSGDGGINVLDLVQVRNRLNQSIIGPCP